jgi:hypothetical protein
MRSRTVDLALAAAAAYDAAVSDLSTQHEASMTDLPHVPLTVPPTSRRQGAVRLLLACIEA